MATVQTAPARASLLILLLARGVRGATAGAEGCEAMMGTVLLQFDASAPTHDPAGADSPKGMAITASTTVQRSDDRMSARQAPPGQWSLIGPGQHCAFGHPASTTASMYLGPGMSASQCQDAALADTDCGVYAWLIDGENYCYCKGVGFGCDLHNSTSCISMGGVCNVYMYQAPTSDAVSGIGDPHLSNTRGEHFDIYQPGNVALLHLPRSAELARTLLLVEAEAKRMGDPCSLYFQVVTISGIWTNQTKPIQFLAKPKGTPEGRNWKEWMRFGPIDLKVTIRKKGVEYINLYARNVGHSGYEVGGLLGLDDHTAVAKRPRQCTHQHAAALFSVAEAM